MDDTRRFLRYVIPGLIFGIDLILLLWLLRPDMVGPKLSALKQDTGLAFIAGSLFASGGLGLIFSSIHHLIHWKFGGTVVDHRPHLKKLIKSGSLCLADIVSKEDDDKAKEVAQFEFIDNITREESWIISTSIWHQLTLHTESEKVDRKSDSFCTLTHSLGTSRVAAVFAGLIAFAVAIYHSQRSNKPRDWVFFILALFTSIFVVWLFHKCYIHTARFARAFSDLVLEYSLKNRGKDHDNSAFCVYVASLKSVYKTVQGSR